MVLVVNSTFNSWNSTKGTLKGPEYCGVLLCYMHVVAARHVYSSCSTCPTAQPYLHGTSPIFTGAYRCRYVRYRCRQGQNIHMYTRANSDLS